MSCWRSILGEDLAVRYLVCTHCVLQQIQQLQCCSLHVYECKKLARKATHLGSCRMVLRPGLGWIETLKNRVS